MASSQVAEETDFSMGPELDVLSEYLAKSNPSQKMGSLKKMDVKKASSEALQLSGGEVEAGVAELRSLSAACGSDLEAVAASLLEPLSRGPALAALGAALTLPVAYALQRRCRALRESRGERIVGYKVGCTSEAVRLALGVGEAVRGYLWEREQKVDDAILGRGDFNDLAIEGEVAVEVITTEGDVEDWLCVYAPCVELHHCFRNCERSARAAEIVARNAIHAGVVAAVAWSPVTRLGDVPLDVDLTVAVDGVLRDRATLASLQLGDAARRGPCATIAWLKAALERDGDVLRPGLRILTATPGPLIPVDADATEIVVAFGKQVVRCAVADEGDARRDDLAEE